MATTKPPAPSQLAPGARITGEQRQAVAADLAQRYQAGESIRSMAADLGRSYGWVQGLLKEHGVERRGRGGATRGAAGAERALVSHPRRRVQDPAQLDRVAKQEIAPVERTAEAPPPARRRKAAERQQDAEPVVVTAPVTEDAIAPGFDELLGGGRVPEDREEPAARPTKVKKKTAGNRDAKPGKIKDGAKPSKGKDDAKADKIKDGAKPGKDDAKAGKGKDRDAKAGKGKDDSKPGKGKDRDDKPKKDKGGKGRKKQK